MASKREPGRLSAPQLGLLMLAKGFPADEDVISKGIGVCTAESSRRRTAKNRSGNSPPSTDRGPWQINDHWHPEVSDACAYSWGCSTGAAHSISDGGSNWGAWTTYHEGIGRPYRGAARRAIKAHASGGDARLASFGLGGLGDLLNVFPDESGLGRLHDKGLGGLNPFSAAGDAIGSLGLDGLVNFFIGLGELILTPEGWVRLGKMLFGVIALIAGVNILIRETTGVNVARSAGSVAAAAPIPVPV